MGDDFLFLNKDLYSFLVKCSVTSSSDESSLSVLLLFSLSIRLVRLLSSSSDSDERRSIITLFSFCEEDEEFESILAVTIAVVDTVTGTVAGTVADAIDA